MHTTFQPTGRRLVAAFYDLYALSLDIEGPLSREQIHEVSTCFSEMLKVHGLKQLAELGYDIPPLSTEDLQDIIASVLRTSRDGATDDELHFEAGLIVQNIQSPNIY